MVFPQALGGLVILAPSKPGPETHQTQPTPAQTGAPVELRSLRRHSANHRSLITPQNARSYVIGHSKKERIAERYRHAAVEVWPNDITQDLRKRCPKVVRSFNCRTIDA